jgi:hypothetical protein
LKSIAKFKVAMFSGEQVLAPWRGQLNRKKKKKSNQSILSIADDSRPLKTPVVLVLRHEALSQRDSRHRAASVCF